MFRHGRCCCSLTSVSISGRSSWDPTVSLSLRHPTLVLLEKCKTREQFKQILAQMMRIHLTTETFPMSRLLYFSAVSNPDNLDMAILLFRHHTPHPNLFIYNTMISALASSSSQSFSLYNSMLRACISPDKHTFLYLLKASKCLSELKQVHGHVLTTSFSTDTYLQNSLIQMYSENGHIDLAYEVFAQMPERDVVSWNTMIGGYARKGSSVEALALCCKMGVVDLKPDEFTMVGLLTACGRLEDADQGKSVHGWICRNLIPSKNLILGNALVDMYTKCKEMELAWTVFDGLYERDIVSWNTMIAGYAKVGELDLALRFFNEMPNKDLVSWNSLIAGYSIKGNCRPVMKLFEEMQAKKIKPDKFTIVSLVSSSAQIGGLNLGRWIHCWMLKSMMELDPFVGSALIDMYSKCGSIGSALTVFEVLPVRDVTVWTAMISGLAIHGYGTRALELFWEMQKVGLSPNGITFIAVLTACSHGGLVDQGCQIFSSMKQIYSIEPGIEHYGCLVDLLGRAGKLMAAKDVIKKMALKPSASIWGSMLSNCKIHGNVKMAEIAARELLKLEPEKEGSYIILSNIYAACERWSYVDKVREIMESRGVKKAAGCSSLIVDGVVHEFVAADKRHPRWTEVYCVLNCLYRGMKPSEELLQDLDLIEV